MAYWGEALSLGPHINSGMSKAAVQMAWDAVRKAGSLAVNTTKKEQDYIQALMNRYASPPAANRGELDRAYADAMRHLAEKHSDDPDAAALFAEALMITIAWDYWESDGTPRAITKEILSTLEQSMDSHPEHPGTNHFYIHTVETRHPERGIEAADRLREHAPQVGHLLHMPSHIYVQVGQYADASTANELAVEADRAYLETHGAQGMYRISYIPHNSVYLCFSVSMEGRSEASLAAAETTRELILEDQLIQRGYGSLTQGYALRYIVFARFGMAKEMLEEKKPRYDMPFITAIWHYARGMAFVRTDDLESADQEFRRLKDLSTPESVARMDYRGDATTGRVLQIAVNMLAGEIAAANEDYDTAIRHLREAVNTESSIGYYEPPVWYAMPRQTLGAVLLAADRAVEAEQVYRNDLNDWPENGWSLFGLYQALKAQGKNEEAQRVNDRFESAWSRADVELTSSRL